MHQSFETEYIALEIEKPAEDEGFEPSIGFPIHAFQACALGRYANPPAITLKPRIGLKGR